MPIANAPLRTAFVVTLAAIPTLSLSGRALFGWLRQTIGTEALSAILWVLAALLVLFWSHWLHRNGGRRVLWHLVWLLPLTVWFVAGFDNPQERVHFVLFGLLGFLSLRQLPAAGGLALCAAVAGLDELLQAFLPARVGDWHDVGANLLAAGFGALVVWLGGGWRSLTHRATMDGGK